MKFLQIQDPLLSTSINSIVQSYSTKLYATFFQQTLKEISELMARCGQNSTAMKTLQIHAFDGVFVRNIFNRISHLMEFKQSKYLFILLKILQKIFYDLFGYMINIALKQELNDNQIIGYANASCSIEIELMKFVRRVHQKTQLSEDCIALVS